MRGANGARGWAKRVFVGCQLYGGYAHLAFDFLNRLSGPVRRKGSNV
jgi:hypothetical protein